MKTYPTFAEAKIDNPGSEIVTTGPGWDGAKTHIGLFEAISAIHFMGETGWVKCNPADHCSTVGDFVGGEYTLKPGDLVLSSGGEVLDIESTLIYCLSKPAYGGDVNSWFVLSSAALDGGSEIPEKKDEPQWNGEGLPPVGEVCEIKWQKTAWMKCKYMGIGLCGDHVVSFDDGEAETAGESAKFRPLKTAEQVEVEKLAYAMHSSVAFNAESPAIPFEKFLNERCFKHYSICAKAAIKNIKGE